MKYGYARVSTVDQDHAAQVEELTAAGCGQVFAEKISGAHSRNRRELAKAIGALQAGDVLAVTRLNRLARSARDALNILEAVSAKGAGFQSLRETWADTTTPGGRFMVTVMAGLAEFDREMIRERTSEGRAAALLRGVKLGRPPALTEKQAEFVREARQQTPPLSLGELKQLLGVSRSTILRAARGAKGGRPRQLDLEEAIARAAGGQG